MQALALAAGNAVCSLIQCISVALVAASVFSSSAYNCNALHGVCDDLSELYPAACAAA